MVGTRVKWKYLNTDGTPMVDAVGVVEAVDVVSTRWVALVKLDSGGYRSFEVESLIDDTATVATAAKAPASPSSDCEGDLEATIKELGLWEDQGKCAGLQAAGLLREFMTELKEKAEEIEALKAKKAKKDQAAIRAAEKAEIEKKDIP